MLEDQRSGYECVKVLTILFELYIYGEYIMLVVVPRATSTSFYNLHFSR